MAVITHQGRLAKQAVETLEAKLAGLQNQHAEDQKEWCTMLAQRKQNSDLSAFSVRGCEGPGLSGKVPRQIFQAEPHSALARIYDGTWQYSTDEQGRAIINSDPAHWPVIIRWLSFGTIPKDPTPEFISECEYWQLDRLLTAIVTQQSSIVRAVPQLYDYKVSRSVIDDNVGFTLEGCICHFARRAANEDSDSNCSSIVRFNAAGRDWKLAIDQDELCLEMLHSRPLTSNLLEISLGPKSDSIDFEESDPCKLSSEDVVAWELTAGEMEALMHPKALLLNGSLQVRIRITFET